MTAAQRSVLNMPDKTSSAALRPYHMQPSVQSNLSAQHASNMRCDACSARDTGVDALRMEALKPSAKRSKTAEKDSDESEVTDTQRARK